METGRLAMRLVYCKKTNVVRRTSPNCCMRRSRWRPGPRGVQRRNNGIGGIGIMQYKLRSRFEIVFCVFREPITWCRYNHDELTLLHPVRPASCTFRPLLDSCNTTNSAPHRFPFLAVICSPSNRSIEPSIARLHGKPFQSVDRAFHSEITWQALPIGRSCRPDGCAPPPTGA